MENINITVYIDPRDIDIFSKYQQPPHGFALLPIPGSTVIEVSVPREFVLEWRKMNQHNLNNIEIKSLLKD